MHDIGIKGCDLLRRTYHGICALDAVVSILQAERDAKWLAFRDADRALKGAKRDLAVKEQENE
jgi:hypothetical protein